MTSIIAQLLGGLLGGYIVGKIARGSDMGVIWNALAGGVGGVAGGQLIGAILGKTEVPAGLDVIAIVGPFIDGALTGALVQIAIGIFLSRLLDRTMARRRRSYF
ncbi:hypothetical protein [Brucella cytisi]|uniref:hypothetical protein n=1 Tax=Brucella cytisi TaxID=407152 RepID=UPI0035BBCE77